MPNRLIMWVMTYARARLLLGITGVGTWVLIAGFGLWYQWPDRFWPWEPELLDLARWVFFYVAISAPLDWLGGFLLPAWYKRSSESAKQYAKRWLHAVAVHGALLTLVGWALLLTYRLGGALGVLSLVAGLMALLMALQLPLARRIGQLALSPAALHPDVFWPLKAPQVAENQDSGFTGGVVGLPGWETLILPATWLNQFSGEAQQVLLTRRLGVLATGSRTRGVWLAWLFQLAGVALFFAMGGVLWTVADVVRLSFAMTLWSFWGVLVLPTLSRYGVFEVDAFSLKTGISATQLMETAALIERQGEDEPRRPAWVETIFHPLPSLANRERMLEADAPRGYWHATRIQLFLSWATLGLLSRAVHCNSGCPERWVMLPSD
jgi:hypothetical protein